MKALLVASRGGHLNEMALLADRFEGISSRVWVTFPGEQADSLLPGEDVRRVPEVNPRSPGAAIRTLPAADRLLRQLRPDVVVSTGAAVALPFFVVAALRRVPAVYLESAARQALPSLTGRLASRLPRVELLGQNPSLPSRWRFAGSVFDGFAPMPLRAPAGRALRVLVTLGTMEFPFARLVTGLRRALPADAEVEWQLGSTPAGEGPLPGRVRTLIPHEELEALMGWCDVLVTHAGVGTALTALAHGRCPVLVPRLKAHREHVDDHQLGTALDLQSRGLAVACDPAELTLDVLTTASTRSVTQRTNTPPIALLERQPAQ